jgi:thymidine phosphorylase
MKTAEQSRRLAESLVSIGNASGVRTEAVITMMDVPLGRTVGNALEVIECVEVLKGRGPSDLVDVSRELAARMLVLGGAAASRADAGLLFDKAIASGTAVERFRRIIEGQGGDAAILDDYGRLPSSPERHIVRASRSGYLTRLDAELVGRASSALGAGRNRVEDAVDPGVGIRVMAGRGDEVREGEGVLELHYRNSNQLAPAIALLANAVAVGDQPPPPVTLVVGEVR